MNTNVPEGYFKNAAGHLVPAELVNEIDIVRNDLVMELAAKAEVLQASIKQFKTQAFDDIAAFVELSAEKYGVSMGGKKGNICLISFDGQYKVLRAMSEDIAFDERLQIAKELIDSCIHRWAEGSGAEIRALVNHAFQVDNQGQVSTSRVLGLRRLDIKDPQWLEAMRAISDSLSTVGSKAYIRIYKRVGNTDRWDAISLDVAGV